MMINVGMLYISTFILVNAFLFYFFKGRVRLFIPRIIVLKNALCKKREKLNTRKPKCSTTRVRFDNLGSNQINV